MASNFLELGALSYQRSCLTVSCSWRRKVHSSIGKDKLRCRDPGFWTESIKKEIPKVITHCDAGIASNGRRNTAKHPIRPLRVPDRLWSKFVLDMLKELHGNPPNALFVVALIDLPSKLPEVRFASHITMKWILQFVGYLFARWGGIPEEHIREKARQVFSTAFAEFISILQIKKLNQALPSTVEWVRREIQSVRKNGSWHTRQRASQSIRRCARC